MTPAQQLKQINDDILMSYAKIRSLEQSMRGFPGIIRRHELEHEIEISQAVITRLKTRMDRIKFKMDVK